MGVGRAKQKETRAGDELLSSPAPSGSVEYARGSYSDTWCCIKSSSQRLEDLKFKVTLNDDA